MTNATFLIVVGALPAREIDHIVHDELLARRHRKELIELGCETVRIYAFVGSRHADAAEEAETLINEGRPFGRKAMLALMQMFDLDMAQII